MSAGIRELRECPVRDSSGLREKGVETPRAR